MKKGSIWIVRLSAAACALIFLFVLRGQIRSFKDVIASLFMLAPFMFIVGVWRHRPEIIIGFSLTTGLAGALIVRLVIGLSHYGMGSAARPSPDYFSYLAYANLALFLASIGSWALNHKEAETWRVVEGTILGLVSWVMLVGISMVFF
jgi:hypothetical protein